MDTKLDKTYFIIGVGNIGQALATRLCDLGVAGSRFTFFDTNADRRQATVAKFGGKSATSLAAGAQADVIVIATPPFTVLAILKELAPTLLPGQLILSMAAANPLAKMRELVPEGVDLVRILPNPPIAHGLGMDPIAYETGISPDNQAYVESLLSALGETVVVQDNQMNWCVGLSGASLRTLLPVLEGMTAAGIEAGLSAQDARLVAAQVMLGTANLVKDSSLSFEELKMLTPMQTVDEPEMKERFLEVARKTRIKADETMAKILAR